MVGACELPYKVRFVFEGRRLVDWNWVVLGKGGWEKLGYGGEQSVCIGGIIGALRDICMGEFSGSW